jgi:hypothetical protein
MVTILQMIDEVKIQLTNTRNTSTKISKAESTYHM